MTRRTRPHWFSASRTGAVARAAVSPGAATSRNPTVLTFGAPFNSAKRDAAAWWEALAFEVDPGPRTRASRATIVNGVTVVKRVPALRVPPQRPFRKLPGPRRHALRRSARTQLRRRRGVSPSATQGDRVAMRIAIDTGPNLRLSLATACSSARNAGSRASYGCAGRSARPRSSSTISWSPPTD